MVLLQMSLFTSAQPQHRHNSILHWSVLCFRGCFQWSHVIAKRRALAQEQTLPTFMAS
jgi:hypothetical protein